MFTKKRKMTRQEFMDKYKDLIEEYKKVFGKHGTEFLEASETIEEMKHILQIEE